jgi:hypothetical protein
MGRRTSSKYEENRALGYTADRTEMLTSLLEDTKELTSYTWT